MLADALAQYLVWKQWRRWFLVSGSHAEDKLYADALRRAAKRFGARIVQEKVFEDTGGARRTDSGVVQIQRQLPVFTQGAPAYDVLVAADESDVFAAYLPYRTWDPRPVAGSAGLIPTSWDASHDQWGAVQMQERFMPGHDQSKVDELVSRVEWDTRIFDERSKTIGYVCEVPVLIEQRLFALARAIQQALE